jgi:ComF family protein
MFFLPNFIPWRFKFQSLCFLCASYHDGKHFICQDCFKAFIPIRTKCQRCAYPLTTDDGLLCVSCLSNPPPIDACFVNYLFQEPLRHLIHQYKYEQNLTLTSTFAALMLQATPQEIMASDCLMPVPMHPLKLRSRGFNHATTLAKSLSQHTRIPLVSDAIKKIVHTPSQVLLDKDERAKNLKGVFVVNEINYQQVTLVDDLMTTGATAYEIAKVLKQKGVKQVFLWCCARAAKEF